MEYETLRTIFQSIVWFGSLLILIGTIGVSIFTKKIENEEKERRVKVEQESKNTTQKMLNLNTFYSELDNKLQSMFLVFTLKEKISVNDLDGFICFIKIDVIQRKYKFEIYSSNNNLYIKFTSIQGSDWTQNTYENTSILISPNVGELALELLPVNLVKEVDTKTIRDLHNTYFQIIVTSNHINKIDKFSLNVNDWDVYATDVQLHNWKQAHENWLNSTSQQLSTFFTTYETRHYTDNRIFFYDEVITRHFINKNQYSKIKLDDKSLAYDLTKDINPEEGTLLFHIDNAWLNKNNAFISYVEGLQKGVFKLNIYRDKDNILKVDITTQTFSKSTLICSDMRPFASSQLQHELVVTWSKNEIHLYINGREVDKKVIET